jgi:hypothetical protein
VHLGCIAEENTCCNKQTRKKQLSASTFPTWRCKSKVRSKCRGPRGLRSSTFLIGVVIVLIIAAAARYGPHLVSLAP